MKLSEHEQAILTHLTRDAYLTMEEIAERTGLSKRQVQYGFDSLREKGLLVRVGNRRAGYWEIVTPEIHEK